MSSHVVQTVSGKAIKRNVGKRSVLPHCNREAGFKQLVQENAINTIMKNMKKNSPLEDLCPEKNLTNHSARKTMVTKEAEKFWYPGV